MMEGIGKINDLNRKDVTFTCKFESRIEETQIDKNKEILILGQLNNKVVNYWKISEEDFDYVLGDYAIVENCKGYDLVKIVGIVETNEEYKGMLTNSNKIKSVVYIIDKEELENEEE